KGLNHPWFLRAMAAALYLDGNLKEAQQTLWKVNQMWNPSHDVAERYLAALIFAGQGNVQSPINILKGIDHLVKRRPNSYELAFLRAEVEAAIKALQSPKAKGGPP